jgi:hypothetical protein
LVSFTLLLVAKGGSCHHSMSSHHLYASLQNTLLYVLIFSIKRNVLREQSEDSVPSSAAWNVAADHTFAQHMDVLHGKHISSAILVGFCVIMQFNRFRSS